MVSRAMGSSPHRVTEPKQYAGPIMGTSTRFSLPACTIDVAVSGCTDIGKRRQTNEDAMSVRAPVYAVADGMGGHARGDDASRMVVEALQEATDPQHPTAPVVVADAVRRVNHDIAGQAAGEVMGTTVTGVALVDPDGQGECHWMVFNIGDSRVYSFERGLLAQVTVDHSAVGELVRSGSISEEEARRHPDRNILTRAVGVEDDADPEVWMIPASGTQRFLICSDGLTRELSDDQIADVLRSGEEDPAETLVDCALARGGHDNVSAVVIESQVHRREAVVQGGDSGSATLEVSEDTLPRAKG